MNAQAAGGGVMGFLPLLLMLVVFYFMLIRPNQKREKAIKEMRASLQVGDQVMTIGAIGGTIISLTETSVILEVAPDNHRIQVERWGIGRKVEAQEVAEPSEEIAESEEVVAETAEVDETTAE